MVAGTGTLKKMGFIYYKKRLCRILAVASVFLSISISVYGQALRGTTGLLHAPTADMQRDKTFMFGGNVLDVTPLHYYDFDVRYTFNYYLNVTIFPWLEVGYTCTLNYADEGSTYFPKQSWGKYTNQDRSFNFRLRAWKEGWWKTWTPQIVIGVDGLNLMVEYDARTCNVGFEYSFWKDYINAVVELNRCKYFSGGIVFKVHLK